MSVRGAGSRDAGPRGAESRSGGPRGAGAWISCDWGTSSFRLRLVNGSDLSILAARTTAQGIISTHRLWAAQPSARLSFYQAILREAIRSIGQELGKSLEGLPLVISGMASSTLGMMELPYKELPFSLDGSDLRVETLSAGSVFNHDILLISGARTANDVMRGEETQLVGCETGGEQVFIFPGTHSKHVWVRDGRAMEFKTYMTGEFFELLSKKSILAGDVADREGEQDPGMAGGRPDGFEKGVREGVRGNLLHSSFLVRTNRLLQGVSKEENYQYLSGLLIGAELGELTGKKVPVTLISEGVLKERYVTASRILGLDEISEQDAGGAVLRGQWKTMMARNY